MVHKLEKVRKKADNILGTVDVSDKEKMNQIKSWVLHAWNEAAISAIWVVCHDHPKFRSQEFICFVANELLFFRIYKKAGLLKKQKIEKKYVVAKKKLGEWFSVFLSQE